MKALHLLKNQKGIALLMAIFTFVFISAISMELLEETQVEYITAAQSVHRLKAYYAAKSGIELSLLRILIYKKTVALAGNALPDPSLLAKIWQFPFIWPPVLGDQIGQVSKELIETSVKESFIDAQIATTIMSEGSKIDINDLGSPSKSLSEATEAQILRLFENRVETDETFAKTYRGYDFKSLVNNLTDWVDENSESKNGGAEGRLYSSLGTDTLPPHQPFKTLSELHMVAGMTDELFEVIAPNITVYGVAGIQVNSAPKQILMSIHPDITEEIADEIIKHINDPDEGGPFSKEEDFIKFLQDQGVQMDEQKLKEDGIPLIFSNDINFRLVSTGSVGNTTREIVALTYDFDTVKARVSEILKKDAEKSKNGESDDETGDDAQLTEKCKDKEGNDKARCLCEDIQGSAKKLECIRDKKREIEQGKKENQNHGPPKGRPNVVYWFES